MTSFTCKSCGKQFTVPEAALAKYPGWKPSTCRSCKGERTGKEKVRPSVAPMANERELNLTVDEVLSRFTAGPTAGVFTDGACVGNPGPGGWGSVYVHDNKVVEQRYGKDPATTNNRMELMALINGYQLVPKDQEITIWSDSELCVKIVNEWADKWAANGWRRKTGPVKNLELVQQLYAEAKAHPKVSLRWIRAHDGSRWNEYADSLATAFLREKL